MAWDTTTAMAAMPMQRRTIRQLVTRLVQISAMLGVFFQLADPAVSARLARSQNMTGITAQPSSNGIRHPQLCVWLGVSVISRQMPTSDAAITANCWLAACQHV